MIGGDALEEDLGLVPIDAGICPLGPGFQGSLVRNQPIHVLERLPTKSNEVPSAFPKSDRSKNINRTTCPSIETSSKIPEVFSYGCFLPV